jgi:hypothetical protein
VSDPLQEARRLSEDLNIVYGTLEDAYMTRKMHTESREALNRVAQRVEDAESALRNISHTDDAEHARQIARQALRQEERHD